MDNSQMTKVLVGAAIGGVFAFLFLTSRGHRILENAEPWLDDVIRDLQRLQSAAGKAKDAMDEGRRSFAAMSEAVPFGKEKPSRPKGEDWHH